MQEYHESFETKEENRVPIWRKAAITIDEAAEYSNIGKQTLKEIISQKGCPFVFRVGRKRLIKRVLFDEYINQL